MQTLDQIIARINYPHHAVVAQILRDELALEKPNHIILEACRAYLRAEQYGEIQ